MERKGFGIAQVSIALRCFQSLQTRVDKRLVVGAVEGVMNNCASDHQIYINISMTKNTFPLSSDTLQPSTQWSDSRRLAETNTVHTLGKSTLSTTVWKHDKILISGKSAAEQLEASWREMFLLVLGLNPGWKIFRSNLCGPTNRISALPVAQSESPCMLGRHVGQKKGLVGGYAADDDAAMAPAIFDWGNGSELPDATQNHNEPPKNLLEDCSTPKRVPRCTGQQLGVSSSYPTWWGATSPGRTSSRSAECLGCQHTAFRLAELGAFGFQSCGVPGRNRQTLGGWRSRGSFFFFNAWSFGDDGVFVLKTCIFPKIFLDWVWFSVHGLIFICALIFRCWELPKAFVWVLGIDLPCISALEGPQGSSQRPRLRGRWGQRFGSGAQGRRGAGAPKGRRAFSHEQMKASRR